jgi:type 1 fimbria pilin
VFTITPVANDQTNAVITVGFTGRNTAANVSVEVYDNSSGLLPPSNTANGTIVKLTINNPGNYYYTPNVTPNSVGSGAVITFNKTNWTQTANAQTAVIIKQ